MSRTVLLAVAIAVVIGGLAVASLRSLNGTANASVDYARDRLPQDAVEPIEALANDISAASSRLTLLLILITVIGAIAAGALALVFARQITSPIVRLRNAAMKSADALPEIVEASANGNDELPELPSIVLTSGDEVEELANSFNTVQRTAAELAVKQARMRRHNGERFVNLGRRSQNLLARQMKFIDAMEQDETNPENLQRLFQIDHLATRMRRNAESVLVLAEEGSPRRLRGPVSMHQVVQAASGEIEHFDRIAISDISDVFVEASVAHDLAHLLAELLENATSFAPPDTATNVSGRSTERGYLLEIIDHGIGMESDAMALANARFAAAPGSLQEEHSPSYLGHEVIARLARRHGLRVELSPTATGGLTARLELPQETLASPSNPTADPAAAEAVAEHAPAAPDAGIVAPNMNGAFADDQATADSQLPVVEPATYSVENDATSLDAFTPQVPDDASALVQADPPGTDAFTSDAASFEANEFGTDFGVGEFSAPSEPAPLAGFTGHIPDDVSSLVESGADDAFSTPSIPDDASSLIDMPDASAPTHPFDTSADVEVPSFDIPTFDAPEFDAVPPAPEIPDVPGIDALAPAQDPFEDLTQPAAAHDPFQELTEPAAAPAAEMPEFDIPAFDEAPSPTPITEASSPATDVLATHGHDEAVADFEIPEFEQAPVPAAEAPMAEVPMAPVEASPQEVAAEAPPSLTAADHPPAPAAAVEDTSIQSLTDEQRAAIEWATTSAGGASPSAAATAAPATAAAASLSDLRPGPIDAATLSELGTAPTGFVARVPGQEGAKHFSPTAEAPATASSAPDPEHLMQFRQGAEAARSMSDEGGDAT